MTPPRSPDRDQRSPEERSDAESEGTAGLRWQAALTAVFLVVLGAVFGITIDRLWLSPGHVDRPPLTAEAMAESLELTPSEEARVRRVLDSLETEVSEAAGLGPDSLHAAARRARQRLEQALPPHARPEFRRWMEGHHRRMMEEMHGSGRRPNREEGTERIRRDSGQMMMLPASPHIESVRDGSVPVETLVRGAKVSRPLHAMACRFSRAEHIGS